MSAFFNENKTTISIITNIDKKKLNDNSISRKLKTKVNVPLIANEKYLT